jgi:hypothetical protein
LVRLASGSRVVAAHVWSGGALEVVANSTAGQQHHGTSTVMTHGREATNTYFPCPNNDHPVLLRDSAAGMVGIVPARNASISDGEPSAVRHAIPSGQTAPGATIQPE